MVLVQGGKLVAEEYFPRQKGFPAERDRAIQRVAPKQLYFATKSVTSILVGIAIEQGLIHGVDDKVARYFPGYKDDFVTTDKAALCIKDLLSMCAGLTWDEWSFPYSDPRNITPGALLSPDPIRYTLSRPMERHPGRDLITTPVYQWRWGRWWQRHLVCLQISSRNVTCSSRSGLPTITGQRCRAI